MNPEQVTDKSCSPVRGSIKEAVEEEFINHSMVDYEGGYDLWIDRNRTLVITTNID